MVSIGWSDFARKQHALTSGNSYTLLPDGDLIKLLQKNWDLRTPGMGEGENLHRKVLVPIPADKTDWFFTPPYVEPKLGLPVKSRLIQRQEGEAPYLQTYVTWKDVGDGTPFPVISPEATSVNVVCYSVDALLENDGKRSTECEWEIVCILASNKDKEPMTPLTMARNYLEKDGGTFGDYSAKDFAESIWYWSIQKGISVRSDE